MKLLGFLITWLRRLPYRFTGLFVVCMLGYLVVVSAAVKVGGVETVSGLLWSLLGLPSIPAVLGIEVAIRVFWEGLIVVSLLLVGVVASYNLSAFAYRRIRVRPRVSVGPPVPPTPGRGRRLDGFAKIGIILAGGGAKGAYQAGAMKAIYEFLEANDALGKVKMIAGTSIGSWNAMFWLADLVKARDGGPSIHEQWWRGISVAQIMEFDTYLPLRANHFLRPTPWREMFRNLFAGPSEMRDHLARLFAPAGADRDPPLHFYFTRSNVERGHLEFATNWPGLASLTRPRLRTPNPGDVEPVVPADRYELIRGDDVGQLLSRTERAVFASMDLPPLFPYIPIKLDMTEWFEDGGVVENLPVWFGAQVEHCDLLFVLPLNASFGEPANHTSVVRRLYRVVDVRQGVIERSALKFSYLYNELAALRTTVEELRGTPQTAADGGTEQRGLEARALKRRHRPISLFAICPAPPLGIGTTEFWKPREAGAAFEVMYAATKHELAENFEADTDPNWVRMTLVSPQGERTQTDDF